MTAIEWLVSCASSFDIDVRVHDANAAIVEVNVPRSSGTKVSFLIGLQGVSGHEVTAKEVSPKRLPDFCPERHINPGGSFCLYWSKGDSRPVTNSDTASEWWKMLIQYLGWQATATKLRRWVGGSRAHGDAAQVEAEVELVATAFGNLFERDLRNGIFRVQRRVHRAKHYLELYRGSCRVARIGTYRTAMLNARAPCPCDASGGARLIGECSTHASELKHFIKLMHQLAQANQHFIDELRRTKQVCCDTLESCPLRG